MNDIAGFFVTATMTFFSFLIGEPILRGLARLFGI